MFKQYIYFQFKIKIVWLFRKISYYGIYNYLCFQILFIFELFLIILDILTLSYYKNFQIYLSLFHRSVLFVLFYLFSTLQVVQNRESKHKKNQHLFEILWGLNINVASQIFEKPV